MISSVKINKLFGRFNYELKFMPANIMIITGPNGYGKSTILKMINSFCDDNLQKLLTYTFKKFEITCDDCNVAITKNEKSFKINDYAFPYPDDKIIHRRGVPPFIRRVGYDEYMDLRTNQIIKMNGKDIFIDRLKEDFQEDRFFELLFLSLDFSSTKKSHQSLEELKKAFSLVKKVKQSIGKIQFIQEQRLIERRRVPEEERAYSEPKEKYVTVINENSEKLKADQGELVVDENDKALYESFVKEHKDVVLKVVKYRFGGFKYVDTKDNVEYDYTLDTRFDEQTEWFKDHSGLTI